MTNKNNSITQTRRQVLMGLSALGAMLALPGGAMAQMGKPAKQFLSMGTSSVGGSWFSLGGIISNEISKNVPELRVTAEATGGSVDNLNLIKNNNIELGLTTNAEAYEALHGMSPFEEKIDNFSALMSGGGIFWQLYTLEKTGIESIRDLKGKRVSLGAPGSIGNMVGKTIIEAHGLKMVDDWQPEYLSHSDGPDALRDGTVDATLIVSTLPTSVLINLTSSEGSKVKFLNPEPEILADLKEQYPYWIDVSIPGGIYNGHPDDIPGSFGFATVLIASNDLSDEAVFAITKTICENGDALASAHASGKDWVYENALKGIKDVLPIHPGANAYFKQRGLL